MLLSSRLLFLHKQIAVKAGNLGLKELRSGLIICFNFTKNNVQLFVKMCNTANFRIHSLFLIHKDRGLQYRTSILFVYIFSETLLENYHILYQRVESHNVVEH